MFRPHVRICLAAFTLDFAIMIGITITPFFVINQLGGTEQTTGAFGAIQAAAYAGMALASARFVSKTHNGLNWAVGGIMVYAVFYGAMVLFKDWRLCLLVSCIASAALALVWPALHSWVGAEPEPAVRARHMSWLNISWSFGFSLSPLLAGPLYDANYLFPFVALALISVISLALVRSMPHETEHFEAPTEEFLAARADHDRASEMFLMTGWCATFVANLLAGAVRSIYPKRIMDLVRSGELRVFAEAHPPALLTSAPATNFSFLAFSFSFATAVTFLVLGRTTAWKHKFGLLFWMQLLSAFAYCVLGITHSLVVMCICCAVAGSFLGLAFFSATYYSLASPEHKHGRAAINEFAVGIGGFAGSLAAGFVAQRFGVTVPFSYMPVVVVVALVAQWALLRGKQRVA